MSTNLFDVHEIASIFQGRHAFILSWFSRLRLNKDESQYRLLSHPASSFVVTKRILLVQVSTTRFEYKITQQHFVDTFMSLFLDWKTVILGFVLKFGTCLHELMVKLVFSTKSSLNLWTQAIYTRTKKIDTHNLRHKITHLVLVTHHFYSPINNSARSKSMRWVTNELIHTVKNLIIAH